VIFEFFPKFSDPGCDSVNVVFHVPNITENRPLRTRFRRQLDKNCRHQGLWLAESSGNQQTGQGAVPAEFKIGGYV
jgi:hypothetical protein